MRVLLEDIFRRAVAAAHPVKVLPPALAGLVLPDDARVTVVGAGKAAAAMAAALEQSFCTAGNLSGLVLTRYGHACTTRSIEVVEAGHPLPDAQGQAACLRMLDRVVHLQAEDTLIVLLSGGASSLLALPEAGITLADLRSVCAGLLASGAPIADINLVRRHLSFMLGGKLAARCSARIEVFLISDVVGDDPSVIASGPCHVDASTSVQALACLEAWRVPVPARVRAFLDDRHGETVKPGDPLLARVTTHQIANAATAQAAAADALRACGVSVIRLGEHFEEEARVLGAQHAAVALRLLVQCASRPLALLSGGETRVRVSGSGRGGRNTEYLLSLALHLEGTAGIHALACDTDGIDGTEDNAGAYLAPDSLARARALGLDAAQSLANNDAYGFFSALGDLVVTGPTRTNVNDLRLLLLT